MYIYLPKIRSFVSLSPSWTVVVSLAMEHFLNNTQGQCGEKQQQQRQQNMQLKDLHKTVHPFWRNILILLLLRYFQECAALAPVFEEEG